MSYALGSDFVRSQKGLSIKKDEMYHIPILSSLQQFLSNKAILNEGCLNDFLYYTIFPLTG